ncbi:acetamidase/formamidase family protein [soil metagenome]
MTRIPRDKLVYSFNAQTPPVATISSGDFITVETHDTSSGRIHSLADFAEFIRTRDPLKVNPAAGPIYVEDAEPGDALAVKILSIQLGPYGFVRALPGAGVIQDGLRDEPNVMVQAVGDNLIFGDKLRFKARPMVGVLGTAPKEGRVYTAHPGPQGSNIDFNAARVGSTVYLPVHVPGGLLAIGDVHASMGDGEVSGTGVEISGEVMVSVTLFKGKAPKRPWIETDESWISTGQGENLDDAVHESVEEMIVILMRELKLDRTDAYLLISARGDVRIGQSARIKGCDETAYIVFGKDIIRLN